LHGAALTAQLVIKFIPQSQLQLFYIKRLIIVIVIANDAIHGSYLQQNKLMSTNYEEKFAGGAV
jgi:hypothetical protein